MLDPDYLLEIADGAEEIAGMLHEEVLRVIVRRIVARLERAEDYLLTASDRWALEVLQEAGYLREDLIETIARLTKLEAKEVRKAFEEAGVKALEKDAEVYRAAGLSPEPLKQSPHLVRLMQRGYDKTMGEWTNLTGTLADAAQQLFISQCDRAYHLVSTGAESYQTAVRKAVEAIAKDGVRITYPSGHTDTVETATLRAVRTGVAQATADITLARMEEFDWDLLKVDAHIGARTGDGGENYTNHYWWQGKIYSRSGKDKRYPPFSVCNFGHVQGICGANCRHGFGPSNEVDEDEPPYDSAENQKLYDLRQEQRRLERRVRKTKREAMTLKEGVQAAEESGNADTAAELRKSYEKKAALLQKQNKAYNDFCAENGLKRQQERLHIAGWNKSQASAASAAARKNSVQNSDDLPSDSEINLERTSSDVDKMLNEYSSRDSKWSRNTIVKKANSMPGVMGRKEWGCDITLREDAGFKTVVHEHLHARSISYYDQKTYIIHQRIEEATVELYAQEICKQRDIAFRPAYAELVQKLQIINSITRHGTLFDFAKELFDIPLKNRYSWLRERANEVIATGKLSVKTEESLNEAVDYFHGKALDNG